jgi:membrane-bound ClpP family serine protease
VDFEQFAVLFAIVIGVALLFVGVRRPEFGGRALMLLGAAFIVGPVSPLTRGQLSEAVRVALSVAAILLTASAVTLNVVVRFRDYRHRVANR